MARTNDLHLISKLRKDAAMFEKYEGAYGGKGAKKKYGARLRYDLMATRILAKKRAEKRPNHELLSRNFSAQRVWMRSECGDNRQNKFENKENGTRDFIQQRCRIGVGKVIGLL